MFLARAQTMATSPQARKSAPAFFPRNNLIVTASKTSGNARADIAVCRASWLTRKPPRAPPQTVDGTRLWIGPAMDLTGSVSSGRMCQFS